MEEDIRFRIEAAARVLERAAGRTSDAKLRERLLDLAGQLRSLTAVAEHERRRTIDEIVDEVREFIWRGMRPRHKAVSNYERVPLLGPVELLERRVDELVRSFERKLEKIDEALRMIP